MKKYLQRHPASRLAFFVGLMASLTVATELRGQARTAASAAGIASEDLHQLKSVSDVVLSPDGRTMAYTVQNRERPGRPYSQIWIADVGGGAPRLLAGPSESTSSPLWSPDGRWIAYSGSLEGKSGIVIRRPDGSDARLVTETTGTNHPLPGTGADVTWSPDSRRIAYLSATAGPE
ncbi:MAG: TolB family protein, partial [Longimicrobiales bacterium]